MHLNERARPIKFSGGVTQPIKISFQDVVDEDHLQVG